MEIEVLNIEGKATGKKITLASEVFGIEPVEHAVYLDVKHFLANQRQGTHKAKERGEVVGSTRKIKRQKGTGTARAGSIKSPIFKGGGTIFGPRPRYYGFKLNKKTKQLARKSVLSDKAKNGGIIVVEDFALDTPKTKEFKSILSNLKIEDKKSLFVLADSNKNVYLSARNLQASKVVTASDVNTYGVMNAKTLVLTENAIEVLTQNLNK